MCTLDDTLSALTLTIELPTDEIIQRSLFCMKHLFHLHGLDFVLLVSTLVYSQVLPSSTYLITRTGVHIYSFSKKFKINKQDRLDS